MSVPFPAVDRHTRLELLDPPSGRASIVLDTDAVGDPDDRYAIAYSLLSAELDVEAIYAAPNEGPHDPAEGMEKSYDRILETLDRFEDSPDGLVLRGSRRYLDSPDDPVESPAAADIVERARRDRDGPLYVVAIGAATNVASALLMDPDVASEIVVVWLGGHPGYWSSADEFNLRQDRHASRILFDSGVALVHVPCKNVAEHLRISVPELERHLDADRPLAAYLLDVTADWLERRGAISTVAWDVVPVAYLCDPGLVPSRLVHAPILTGDLTWSHDPDRHFVRTAWDVERDDVWRDVFGKLNAADARSP